MQVNSIKNFDTAKLFQLLKTIYIIFEGKNDKIFEHKHQIIKKLIEDSNLLYWKYIHIEEEFYEKHHFRIVGRYKKFWNLELGEEWFDGFNGEDNEIKFSKKLKDVFPEIENIKNLQKMMKQSFQMFKNKLIWSPKSLGGKFTKNQIIKLFNCF
jgi:hypothetical protein